MAEILHWLTLYAPVVFAIQMWFGPGWCCPPPCPKTVDCGLNCMEGFGPEEYEVVFGGIVNSNDGGYECGDCTQFNGTWIIPLVTTEPCQYALTVFTIFSHQIKWKTASSCRDLTSGSILVFPPFVGGGVQSLRARFTFEHRVNINDFRNENHRFFGQPASDDCCKVNDDLPWESKEVRDEFGVASKFTCESIDGECHIRSLGC